MKQATVQKIAESRRRTASRRLDTDFEGLKGTFSIISRSSSSMKLSIVEVIGQAESSQGSWQLWIAGDRCGEVARGERHQIHIIIHDHPIWLP
jgi:hypothetical protein